MSESTLHTLSNQMADAVSSIKTSVVQVQGRRRPGRPSFLSAQRSIAIGFAPREIVVIELLAEGHSNKAIASRLGISDQTVKFHVASICAKLGASNRTDAVRRAARRGLITL